MLVPSCHTQSLHSTLLPCAGGPSYFCSSEHAFRLLCLSVSLLLLLVLLWIQIQPAVNQEGVEKEAGELFVFFFFFFFFSRSFDGSTPSCAVLQRFACRQAHNQPNALHSTTHAHRLLLVCFAGWWSVPRRASDSFGGVTGNSYASGACHPLSFSCL